MAKRNGFPVAFLLSALITVPGFPVSLPARAGEEMDPRQVLIDSMIEIGAQTDLAVKSPTMRKRASPQPPPPATPQPKSEDQPQPDDAGESAAPERIDPAGISDPGPFFDTPGGGGSDRSGNGSSPITLKAPNLPSGRRGMGLPLGGGIGGLGLPPSAVPEIGSGVGGATPGGSTLVPRIEAEVEFQGGGGGGSLTIEPGSGGMGAGSQGGGMAGGSTGSGAGGEKEFFGPSGRVKLRLPVSGGSDLTIQMPENEGDAHAGSSRADASFRPDDAKRNSQDARPFPPDSAPDGGGRHSGHSEPGQANAEATHSYIPPERNVRFRTGNTPESAGQSFDGDIRDDLLYDSPSRREPGSDAVSGDDYSPARTGDGVAPPQRREYESGTNEDDPRMEVPGRRDGDGAPLDWRNRNDADYPDRGGQYSGSHPFVRGDADLTNSTGENAESAAWGSRHDGSRARVPSDTPPFQSGTDFRDYDGGRFSGGRIGDGGRETGRSRSPSRASDIPVSGDPGVRTASGRGNPPPTSSTRPPESRESVGRTRTGSENRESGAPSGRDNADGRTAPVRVPFKEAAGLGRSDGGSPTDWQGSGYGEGDFIERDHPLSRFARGNEEWIGESFAGSGDSRRQDWTPPEAKRLSQPRREETPRVRSERAAPRQRKTETVRRTTTKPAAAPTSGKRPSSAARGGWTSIVLWVGVGLAAVLFILIIKDRLSKRKPAKKRAQLKDTDASEEDEPTAVYVMEISQDEVDRLAGEGRFAEAMHLLLLRSLIEIHKSIHAKIAHSLTSREILRQVPLSPDVRGALGDIVGWVEVAHFGRHLPTKDDYLACRSSFRHLTGGLQGKGTATSR